jgi:hypothetical protein
MDQLSSLIGGETTYGESYDGETPSVVKPPMVKPPMVKPPMVKPPRTRFLISGKEVGTNVVRVKPNVLVLFKARSKRVQRTFLLINLYF